MAIKVKNLSAPSSQRSKNHPALVIKPSKPLRAKSPGIADFLLSANEQSFESQQEISRPIKPRNTHNPRANLEKQAKPQRNSISESQRCISDGDAIIRNRQNSKFMQKNATHINAKSPAQRASNKQVVEHENSSAVTSKEASNDNDYKDSPSLVNVTTLPKQGVLIQNENTNLPISTIVKAEVKVDRLSTTNDVPPHQHEEVLKAIQDLHKADKDGLHLRKQKNKHGSRYNYNYKIYCGNKYLGFLSVSPLKSTDRFIRLDFNPSKIRQSECKLVAQAMRSIIGMNATEIINGASITRLDIAVDLYNIDINSQLYFSARPIDSSTWGKIFKHGKEVKYILESQYIGASGSDHYFSVYDKRAERIAKSGGKDDPGHKIVRVELRIKPRQIKGTLSNSKCSVQFDNLESMDNLFQKLCITEIPVPDDDDGQFALFAYAAQHVGAHTALAMLKNQKKRAEYRKLLLGQASSSWQPEKYWARAIRAVRKTLASIS